MPRPAASELAGLPELLALASESGYLVGIVEPGARPEALGPYFAAYGHAANMRDGAAVEVGGLAGSAQSPRGEFKRHFPSIPVLRGRPRVPRAGRLPFASLLAYGSVGDYTPLGSNQQPSVP